MGPQPFEAVVAQHHGEIFRFLRRVTGRAGDADDLSQETFLRAFRAWPGLAPGANVRAWLYAIAGNLARNHSRHERRRSRAHATVRAAGREADPAGPEGEAVAREARAAIDAVIAALPARQRLAFVMRRVHDLEYDVIAQALGCSSEAARAHVFQAMRKIRRGLDGHLPLPGEPVR